MSASDLATVLEENAVLRRECGRIATKCDEAREERDQAIRERDEARRECCVWGSTTEMGARSLAKFKRWDCYKETKP